MALNYFDTNILAGYIVDAWQSYLETESDPANGKWFRNGPNNGPGLFGGLTDKLSTELVFDQDPGQVRLNKKKEVAASTTLDNRQGLLNDSSATQTLSWQMTSTSVTTHSTSNSVKTGVSEKISFKGKWGVVEVGSETTISFEYQYSWSDTTSNTLTDTKTFTESIPIKVPAGKAYKLVVLADADTLVIPYSAQIVITGTSEANFADPVNGKKNWSTDAGTLCDWIRKYGSAKNDGMEFGADSSDPKRGLASMRGLLSANRAVNFTIFALDVTAALSGDPVASKLVESLLRGESPSEVVLSKPVSRA